MAGGALSGEPAILLTGAGKRYDIVSCFARLTETIVADPQPLAPAQYAAQLRVAVPRMDDPLYVPTLSALCEEHGVGAVLPLTDLDIEILARAAEERRLPALVPSAEVARSTYDKFETHELLGRHSLPSPPTVLPEADLDAIDYPVMVKPRRGSGARSIHLAHDPGQARFFIDYVKEPTMVQRAMNGPEISIDCLGDLEGRCLNAIPRSMLESRGGESIKGQVIRDEELIEAGEEGRPAEPKRQFSNIHRLCRVGVGSGGHQEGYGQSPASALGALGRTHRPEAKSQMSTAVPAAIGISPSQFQVPG